MKFDLHIHSKFSNDSLMTPHTIIKTAKKKGLDGVAVTDHNTIKGGVATFKANKDKYLDVIIGSEVKTEYGDVIGLFLTRDIKSQRLDLVLEEIRSQDGIAILAHPYRQYSNPENLVSKFDLIEAFNARSKIEQNQRANELAMISNKPITGGSDAHLSLYIGAGVTVVDCDIEDALRKGQTMAFGKESNYYLSHGLSIMIEYASRRSKVNL